MSEDDNVVSFPRAEGAPESVDALAQAAERMVADLTAFCERLDEGLQHVAKVLVGMDARLRRLELAHNKAEREKPKPAIFNAQGGRAN